MQICNAVYVYITMYNHTRHYNALCNYGIICSATRRCSGRGDAKAAPGRLSWHRGSNGQPLMVDGYDDDDDYDCDYDYDS